jgi:hypothetical protein
MEDSLAASELLWEEQQRADKAQGDLEHRAWRKGFAVALALIVLTLAVAIVLARLSAGPGA